MRAGGLVSDTLMSTSCSSVIAQDVAEDEIVARLSPAIGVAAAAR